MKGAQMVGLEINATKSVTVDTSVRGVKIRVGGAPTMTYVITWTVPVQTAVPPDGRDRVARTHVVPVSMAWRVRTRAARIASTPLPVTVSPESVTWAVWRAGLAPGVTRAVRLVGMVQAVKPNAVTVTMEKAVTRSMEHAQTDVLPVG